MHQCVVLVDGSAQDSGLVNHQLAQRAIGANGIHRNKVGTVRKTKGEALVAQAMKIYKPSPVGTVVNHEAAAPGRLQPANRRGHKARVIAVWCENKG